MFSSRCRFIGRNLRFVQPCYCCFFKSVNSRACWQRLEGLVCGIRSQKTRFANSNENYFCSTSQSLQPLLHRLLIQAGYDVNIKDYDGWTPLHAAAHWGKEEACRILVENLCDMDLINKMVSSLNCPEASSHWELRYLCFHETCIFLSPLRARHLST